MSYPGNRRLQLIRGLGEVDQIFASLSGAKIFSVYMLDSAGRELWTADMLESEFVPVPRFE